MLGLGFIFRKAQATVDNAIAQMVWGLLIAAPLAVAIGFATAAAANYLHRIYEPELANLIMAGVFAVLAGLVAIGYAARQPETPASEEAKAEEEAAKQSQSGESSAATFPSLSAADRDMLLAALATAAPYAARPILSAALRNLPVLAAIAIAVFVLTRSPPDEAGVADVQPAE